MLSKISSGAACVAGFKTLYDLFAQVLFCMALCISENLTVCLRKKINIVDHSQEHSGLN